MRLVEPDPRATGGATWWPGWPEPSWLACKPGLRDSGRVRCYGLYALVVVTWWRIVVQLRSTVRCGQPNRFQPDLGLYCWGRDRVNTCRFGAMIGADHGIVPNWHQAVSAREG